VIVIKYRSSDNDGIPLTEPVYSTQQKVTILNRDLVLMVLPSATLAWYKQPPAMRVCIKSYKKKITNHITIRMFKSIVKNKGDFNGK
jgi:hypothetical protein